MPISKAAISSFAVWLAAGESGAVLFFAHVSSKTSFRSARPVEVR
jgi:hypothetical protein